MALDRNAHWRRVYETKDPTRTSWHQQTPEPSAALIRLTGIGSDQAVIDVGGGTSKLVDHLLHEGFENVTVLDVAGAALQNAQARLGAGSKQVRWETQDVTRWRPTNTYWLWHDRAVFHFLSDEADRRQYKETLAQVLEPGGFLIIATFAKDGPSRCSDLDVQQFEPAELAAEFGSDYQTVYAAKHDHVTPAGNQQRFSWCVLRRGRSGDLSPEAAPADGEG